MHQTFYIDIDEEITSIVERLKKARANEIVMVVPKGALLIQSIVNLKILRKEADEHDIQLMMVTQDKLGKVLIEKAGIFVQQKMDNIADEEINVDEKGIRAEEFAREAVSKGPQKNRLSKIGSENYFGAEIASEGNTIKNSKKDENGKDGKGEQERLINKELVAGLGLNLKRKSSQAQLDISTKASAIPVMRKKESFKPEQPKLGNKIEKNEKVEDFFYQAENFEDKKRKKKKENLQNYNLSGKDHKWFIIFGIVAVLVVAGILAYLFLPKATLFITANAKTESIDSSVIGNTSVSEIDSDGEIIPAKEVSAEASVTEKFNATGNKSLSNQKARGKITIYNEFSTSPQPLVATTRFLSSDGKLFRLIDGVTIPGMESENGEMKPGTVEAEVIADEAGEDFNIGPDKFTIPGFQNSGADKYAKFYGKSEKAMTGGGSGNQTANSITDADIALAKEKVVSKLDEEIKNKLSEAAGEGVVILDDAISKDEPVYKLSNSSGDIADSFEITIETKAKAIVVNKQDLDNVISKMIEKAKNGVIDIDDNSIKLDFGKANVDFDAGTINVKFHAVGNVVPNLDLEAIKKEILGKNSDELTAYLSTFSDIKEANVEYWPSFINGRIPSAASRVQIILDK